MKAAPLEDYDDQPTNWLGKLKEKIGWGVYDGEEESEYIEEPDGRRKSAMLHVHSARINHVSVWLSVGSFEHAQQAADGLKEGHQQIVNLEKASPEICTRVIDFLNGVVYALDGYVEKVGDKVYLFTPANYVIDVESGERTRKVQSPFHEN